MKIKISNIHVHRIASDAGKFFDRVEEALASAFYPLFSVLTKKSHANIKKLAELPVRHGGLSLSNPTTSAINRALFTAPTSCLPYAVDFNTI